MIIPSCSGTAASLAKQEGGEASQGKHKRKTTATKGSLISQLYLVTERSNTSGTAPSNLYGAVSLCFFKEKVFAHFTAFRSLTDYISSLWLRFFSGYRRLDQLPLVA